MISGPRNRPKMMTSAPRKLHYDEEILNLFFLHFAQNSSILDQECDEIKVIQVLRKYLTHPNNSLEESDKFINIFCLFLQYLWNLCKMQRVNKYQDIYICNVCNKMIYKQISNISFLSGWGFYSSFLFQEIASSYMAYYH